MSDETNVGQATETPESNEQSPKYVTVEDFNRALNSFDKKISKHLATLKTTAPAAQPQKQVADEQPSSQSSSELERLRQENAQWKQFYAEYQRDKAESRKKAREAALDQALSVELERVGVSPSAMKDAKASLRFYDMVKFETDEDDTIVFMSDDDPMPLPLREGIKQWSKSESAARFLPPKGVKGSGDNGEYKSGKKAPQSSGKLTQEDALRLIASRM